MSEFFRTFAAANSMYAAPVAKLVDAPDLGSGVLRCAGSSPVRRTEENPNRLVLSG